MPNALEAASTSQHKILVVGPTGSGKTSQFLTLHGKKFAYLFDPNALQTLRGFDIEYEEFLPDKVDMTVRSLSKDEKKAIQVPASTLKSDMYVQWEKDFDHKLATGFFNQFDWLCIDSSTTLLDLIMDRVLTLNGRFGQWPNEDDYGPQMIAFKNVVRGWTSLKKNIYFTAHNEMRQDQLTKKIWESPMMTGRLKNQIPLLFSDIFSFESSLVEGSPRWIMNTVNDRQQQYHRTSIRGLPPKVDVTIQWYEIDEKTRKPNMDKPLDPEGQGLCAVLDWANAQERG